MKTDIASLKILLEKKLNEKFNLQEQTPNFWKGQWWRPLRDVIYPNHLGQRPWEVVSHWIKGEGMRLWEMTEAEIQALLQQYRERNDLEGYSRIIGQLVKDKKYITLARELEESMVGSHFTEFTITKDGRWIAFNETDGRWYGIGKIQHGWNQVVDGRGTTNRVPAYTHEPRYPMPENWNPGDPIPYSPPQPGSNNVISPGIGSNNPYDDFDHLGSTPAGSPTGDRGIDPWNSDTPYQQA